jgi:hypothetical protein
MVKIPVPAKALWYSRINEIIEQVGALPRPFIDRSTVEFLFGVGRRRAQQILAPCVSSQVGSNGLADRQAFLDHLRRIATGDDLYYETRRRRNVAKALGELQRGRLERPQVLVEAPVQVTQQEFHNLPEGVELSPGRITVTFDQPRQALEKLLALAMAIGNNFDLFETTTRRE